MYKTKQMKHCIHLYTRDDGRLLPDFEWVTLIFAFEAAEKSKSRIFSFFIEQNCLIWNLVTGRVLIWTDLTNRSLSDNKLKCHLTWPDLRSIHLLDTLLSAIPAQPRSNNVVLRPERNRAEWATGVRRNAPVFWCLCNV